QRVDRQARIELNRWALNEDGDDGCDSGQADLDKRAELILVGPQESEHNGRKREQAGNEPAPVNRAQAVVRKGIIRAAGGEQDDALREETNFAGVYQPGRAG